jgi:hypothetical protein
VGKPGEIETLVSAAIVCLDTAMEVTKRLCRLRSGGRGPEQAELLMRDAKASRFSMAQSGAAHIVAGHILI